MKSFRKNVLTAWTFCFALVCFFTLAGSAQAQYLSPATIDYGGTTRAYTGYGDSWIVCSIYASGGRYVGVNGAADGPLYSDTGYYQHCYNPYLLVGQQYWWENNPNVYPYSGPVPLNVCPNGYTASGSSCIPPCTSGNWSCSWQPTTCPASGSQTYTCTQVGTCSGGVSNPGGATQSCDHDYCPTQATLAVAGVQSSGFKLNLTTVGYMDTTRCVRNANAGSTVYFAPPPSKPSEYNAFLAAVASGQIGGVVISAR